MARWQGECEFRNVQSPRHGTRVIETVSAPSKKTATELLREIVACKLFGNSGMYRYIEVISMSRIVH